MPVDRHGSLVLTPSNLARLTTGILLATCLVGSAACNDPDPGTTGAEGTSDSGGGGAGGDTSSGGNTSAGGDTSAGGNTATGGNTSTATGNPSVILECGDNLPYVVSCLLVGPQYTTCSDYFGNHDPKSVDAQCVAGNGTPMTTPCDVQDRAGACVFFNEALSDRCYVEHVAPPSAASFWESTCPAVGGSWVAAE